MEVGYHTIIVGAVYILTALLFIPKSRSNIFDKGYGWMLFAIFHGIDEMVDGMVQVNLFPTFNLQFEKIELASFFVSSSFLLLATLIKINWIRSNDIFRIGFGVQIPVISFFLLASETIIDGIDSFAFTVFSLEIKYFTVIFGLLPTLPLATLYFVEFINVSRKFKGKIMSRNIPITLLILSLMLILYNIGEILASVNILFLYLEVVAISVILLVPLEFNFDKDKRIQLFLVYHSVGYLLFHVKFNTNLNSETVNLMIAFLSAINTLVREELQMGNLEKVETGKGFLHLIHKGDLIYAVLMNEEDQSILQNLHNISLTLEKQLDNINMDRGIDLSLDEIKQMENIVIHEFL